IVLMNLEGFTYQDIDLTGEHSTSDYWILHRLNETARDITRLMDQYEFGETGRLLYDFIWDDLCDWYIEFSKISLYSDDLRAKKHTQSVLCYVLDQTLRLIHPFMPFISEEIWQHLPHHGETVSLALWPSYDAIWEAPEALKEMEFLKNVIGAVRNIRAEVNVPMSKKVELIIKPANDELSSVLQRNQAYIGRFSNTSSLKMGIDLSAPEKAMTSIVSGAELYFPLAGLLDLAQEIARLEKESLTLTAEVERVEKKLANAGFVAKAPAHVIEEEQAKMKDYADKKEKVLIRIAELKN
ncbi:MAG TPA: class I tRNA ligase family protein, partial [Bacilli bacterium]